MGRLFRLTWLNRGRERHLLFQCTKPDTHKTNTFTQISNTWTVTEQRRCTHGYTHKGFQVVVMYNCDIFCRVVDKHCLTEKSRCQDVHSHLSLSMSAVSRLWDDTLEIASNLSLHSQNESRREKKPGRKRDKEKESDKLGFHNILLSVSASLAFNVPPFHTRVR